MTNSIASALILLLTLIAPSKGHAAENTPRVEEAIYPACSEPANWQSLFDGSHLAHWKLVDSGIGYWLGKLKFWERSQSHGGWQIAEDGSLSRTATKGDLITVKQFSDFELKLEWKISEAGNSGIKLRVAQQAGLDGNTGFEMQILDNLGHKDGQNPLTSAGALYGLYPAFEDASKPVGQWNTVHIGVNAKNIEFRLNGKTTVKTRIGTDDWLARFERSPQRERTDSRFASFPAGHILLQDHLDDVWYRDIRICELANQ